MREKRGWTRTWMATLRTGEKGERNHIESSAEKRKMSLPLLITTKVWKYELCIFIWLELEYKFGCSVDIRSVMPSFPQRHPINVFISPFLVTISFFSILGHHSQSSSRWCIIQLKVSVSNLFILVVGVDILKRDGGEFRRELCCHPEMQKYFNFFFKFSNVKKIISKICFHPEMQKHLWFNLLKVWIFKCKKF